MDQSVNLVLQIDLLPDLAILIGPEQNWLTTQQFLDKLDAGLKNAMG